MTSTDPQTPQVSNAQSFNALLTEVSQKILELGRERDSLRLENSQLKAELLLEQHRNLLQQ